MLPTNLLLFLFTVALPTTILGLNDMSSVTIDQMSAYSYQRACGKGCIQNNYDGGGDIEVELGCTWNDCYCGAPYRAAATSIIRSCWSVYKPQTY